jgi:pyruvate/2-oxoglutarate dehydrogenase complex dihydrolipoamide dehydrogenase (E3) component
MPKLSLVSATGTSITGPSITNLSTGPVSTNSRPGESNHWHAALAVVGVGVIAAVVGWLNVKVGKTSSLTVGPGAG